MSGGWKTLFWENKKFYFVQEILFKARKLNSEEQKANFGREESFGRREKIHLKER